MDIEQESTTIVGRKRQLEVDSSPRDHDSEDQRDSDSSEPPTKVPAVTSVIDEIELHFQRSLAKIRPHSDRDHTHRASPLGIEQQIRDSPSPNHQSRQTPPTSHSTSSSSSLSSSPRRHGIHGHKSLPPPLKLASPTPESPNTIHSQHSRPSPHQAIILPTISTTTGFTSLSTPSSVRFSSPSSIAGLPTVTLPNGFSPMQGVRTSPPSTLTRTFVNNSSSGGVAPIQTFSAATLAAAGGGGAAAVYQNVIPVASAHSLTSQHQQRVISQTVTNGSSSPKRSIPSPAANAASAALQTSSGLAAIQLTPGGPVLALPTVSGFQRMAGGLNSMGAAAAGGIQLQAPSVTQPGSYQIIDIPVDNVKSSPPTPLLASAPTLPKAPTVLNVSQIPNLITINPSSPGSASSSPGNKTPTVKVVSVNGSGSGFIGGTQSPIRVSAASTQTTPVATPTLLTPQQLANPSLMSIIDPALSSQLAAAGNSSGGPVYIIPAGSMPMVQQPFFIVNPSATPTDLSSMQQLQQSSVLSGGTSLAGASLVSNPAGGYILVSPGHNAAANFSVPLVNLASTTSSSSSHPAIPNLIPSSPAISKTTPKPASITTVRNTTNISVSANKPPSVKPPLKNQSSTDSAASPSHNDVMMTPASVDDHFAQALGQSQWNKLKGHCNVQPQHC